MVLASLLACSAPHEPPYGETYFLLSIEGVTDPPHELLYLYTDGRFRLNTWSGGFTAADTAITMTFACTDNPCPGTWRGHITIKQPPEPSLIDLREEGGRGRLRKYQRGFEL